MHNKLMVKLHRGDMKKLARLMAALIFTSVIFLPSIQGAAQGSGLSITPRIDITVNKGETKEESLNVTNPSSENPVTLNLNILEFSAKNQTGTPQLNIDDNKTTPWSAKAFMDLPKSVELAPGERKNIPLSVTIPSNQGAGSYYSAIEYRAAGSGDQNVVVNASATTLVFIKVPGETKQQLSLRQLGAFSGDQNSEQGSIKLFYLGSEPRVISYLLKNEGNVAEVPVGSMVLKNTFTGKSIKIDNINPGGALVLREQERRFDTCINSQEKRTQTATGEAVENVCEKPKLSPGRYTITFSSFYGQDNGKSLEVVGSSSFWYLPTWFVVLIVVALLALVALGWWIVHKIKDRATPRRR